jgi:hypothetical protein
VFDWLTSAQRRSDYKVSGPNSSWIRQIDSVCTPGGNSTTTSAAVRRITINLLRAFAAGPTGRVNRSRSSLQHFDTRSSGL